MQNLSNKITVLNPSTLQINEEDHTLMNPLKWVISNNCGDNYSTEERVEFCGYSIPHPSDFISQLTVQFENENDQNSKNVLKKVVQACDVIDSVCDKLLRQIDQ